MQKMDRNKDGVVTIEEFIESCQKVQALRPLGFPGLDSGPGSVAQDEDPLDRALLTHTPQHPKPVPPYLREAYHLEGLLYPYLCLPVSLALTSSFSPFLSLHPASPTP